MVFTKSPLELATTSTATEQEPFADSNPLDKDMKALPEVAVMSPAQSEVTFGVGAMVSPAGKLSIKAALVRTKLLGLLINILKRVNSLLPMISGLNDFVIFAL
jgi:hypothetical protein